MAMNLYILFCISLPDKGNETIMLIEGLNGNDNESQMKIGGER